MSDDDLRLAVRCTDKDQHPTAILGELDLLYSSAWPDGFLMAGDELAAGHVMGHIDPNRKCVWWEDRHDGHGWGRVNIRCPRCGRHVQWRYRRARDVIEAMGRPIKQMRGIGDLPWLDLSHVP